METWRLGARWTDSDTEREMHIFGVRVSVQLVTSAPERLSPWMETETQTETETETRPEPDGHRSVSAT